MQPAPFQALKAPILSFPIPYHIEHKIIQNHGDGENVIEKHKGTFFFKSEKTLYTLMKMFLEKYEQMCYVCVYI